MQPRKTGSDIVVETLTAIGCTTVFGIPGIHNLDIYDALLDSSIRHVTARHEGGAGFMADGYARRTGRPGVALVITGPGLTNIATAMGEAFHDSVPMLVISSQLPRDVADQGTGYLHELRDSTLLARSVAKESRRVPDAHLIADYLTSAYELAVHGRPGPVHVEIPVDVLRQTVDAAPGPATGTGATDGLDALVTAAEEAGSVAFIAGGGAVSAREELLELSRSLAAPVATTLAGKGVLPDNDPLSLGTRLHTPAVRRFLAETDLVIGVGTQLSLTDLWEQPRRLGGTVAQINVDPADHRRNYPADIGITTDSREALSALLGRLTARRNDPPGADGRTGERRAEVEDRVAAALQAAATELPDVLGITPERFARMQEIFSALRRAIPEPGVLVTDMTSPAYVGLSEYAAGAPRTFMHPVGYGTLGFALPAGVGVAVSEPDTPVCVLAGDGGFQFSMQELGVAAEEKLPIPIVIYNDGGYGEIRRSEELRHPGRHIAVDLRAPDFLHLAETYGIRGRRVADTDALEREVRAAFREGGPSIIELEDR